MNKFLQFFLIFGIILICLLLTANLYIDYHILKRMPPTIEEVKNANSNQRLKLMLKQPMVHCSN